jgi:sec-independent protein translocase protein TatA
MGRIGVPELVLILLILLLVFGANRLPELGRGFGKAIRGFKDATNEDEHRDDRRSN